MVSCGLLDALATEARRTQICIPPGKTRTDFVVTFDAEAEGARGRKDTAELSGADSLTRLLIGYERAAIFEHDLDRVGTFGVCFGVQF